MNQKEVAFIHTVRAFYEEYGRHTLPWRKTTNVYRILVSEIMLQQTQVDRVIPKYKEFLKAFPTIAALRKASLGEVLTVWQGLGYNRRAKMLHECVKAISTNLPDTYEGLMKLPGVGPYTAGAVCAFAYNKPVPIIETNIRTVYLHHFFKDKKSVSDAAIMKKVERTLDRENPRTWYWALMDYGAHLKKTVGNMKGAAYTKQSTFKGSDREVRGAIVRTLASGEPVKALPFAKERLQLQLQKLVSEGMIEKRGGVYRLP